jgi:hypothetical protein
VLPQTISVASHLPSGTDYSIAFLKDAQFGAYSFQEICHVSALQNAEKAVDEPCLRECNKE